MSMSEYNSKGEEVVGEGKWLEGRAEKNALSQKRVTVVLGQCRKRTEGGGEDY